MDNLWGNIDEIEAVNTAEDIVKEQCEFLQEQTNGLVKPVFVKYEKSIGGDMIYVPGLTDAMAGVLTGSKQDVQSLLGETEGEGKITYEFAITTPRFVGYRYRAFFLQHSIAPYPVTITMEASIAKEINEKTSVVCTDSETFIDCLAKIFTSKRVKSIIQNILVYQEK